MKEVPRPDDLGHRHAVEAQPAHHRIHEDEAEDGKADERDAAQRAVGGNLRTCVHRATRRSFILRRPGADAPGRLEGRSGPRAGGQLDIRIAFNADFVLRDAAFGGSSG